MRWVWENPARARKRTPEWSYEEVRAANPEGFYERLVAAEASAVPAGASAGQSLSPGVLSGSPVAGAIADGPTAEVLVLIEGLLGRARSRAGVGELPSGGGAPTPSAGGLAGP